MDIFCMSLRLWSRFKVWVDCSKIIYSHSLSLMDDSWMFSRYSSLTNSGFFTVTRGWLLLTVVNVSFFSKGCGVPSISKSLFSQDPSVVWLRTLTISQLQWISKGWYCNPNSVAWHTFLATVATFFCFVWILQAVQHKLDANNKSWKAERRTNIKLACVVLCLDECICSHLFGMLYISIKPWLGSSILGSANTLMDASSAIRHQLAK